MGWHLDVALALIALVGLSLGLLGGGGSILAVPVLVYVARLAPNEALAMSLLIVGGSSVVGATMRSRDASIDWRVAAIFGGAGLATAFVGGLFTHLVPARALLASFAVLMVVVGGWMLLRPRLAPDRVASSLPPRLGYALAAGAAVGAVTGLLGVGGGFLIVPALIAFTGLDMRRAVGTSLVVITINSAAALLGHVSADAVRWPLGLAFTLLSVGGAIVGARLGRRIAADKLQLGFAGLVIVVGVAMVLRTGWVG